MERRHLNLVCGAIPEKDRPAPGPMGVLRQSVKSPRRDLTDSGRVLGAPMPRGHLLEQMNLQQCP